MACQHGVCSKPRCESGTLTPWFVAVWASLRARVCEWMSITVRLTERTACPCPPATSCSAARLPDLELWGVHELCVAELWERVQTQNKSLHHGATCACGGRLVSYAMLWSSWETQLCVWSAVWSDFSHLISFYKGMSGGMLGYLIHFDFEENLERLCVRWEDHKLRETVIVTFCVFWQVQMKGFADFFFLSFFSFFFRDCI